MTTMLSPSPEVLATMSRRHSIPAKFGIHGLLAVAVVLLFSLAMPQTAQAQTEGQWTWTEGSSTVGTTCYGTYPCGVAAAYGTKGTSSTANTPGSRYDATSWTDASGNKWLFGGFGYVAGPGLGEHNDLWEANSSGTAWEWVSGNNAPGYAGVYPAEVGTSGSTYLPGGREGAASWVDKSGNLWLFGGFGRDGTGGSTGFGYENDLWMYNPTTNQWTWESGSSSVPPYTYDSSLGITTYGASAGVYGTMGTPGTGNTPGGRQNAATWTDANGNLWLFGGGYTNYNGITTEDTFYNDLWEFDTTAKQWTYVAGSETANAAGVYGSQGFASSGNIPGARYQAGSWTDKSGNFWIFGGYGVDTGGNTAGLDDLWEYSTSSGKWTFEFGSETVATCGSFLFGYYACEQPGSYGTQGAAGASNVPGGRSSPVTSIDSSGNLWLFGGAGADANGNEAWLNDLWEFNPNTPNSVTGADGEWTWMGGNSTIPATCATGNCGQPGVYPSTVGTSTSSSLPGARLYSTAWTDLAGDFWLYGGWGEDANAETGYLNDMWEFVPPGGSTTPTAATPTFSPGGGVFTTEQTVTIDDATAGATIYYTTDGSTPTTSSLYLSPGGSITVSSNETITAIAVASGYSTSAAASAYYNVSASNGVTPTVTVTPASSSVTTTQSLSVTVGVSGTIVCAAVRQKLTATLASPETACGASATGSVVLSGGGYTSSAVTLASGSATFIIPAGALSSGTDLLTATYAPDAASNAFNPATGTNSVTVNATGGGTTLTSPVWTWVGGSEGKTDTIPTSFGTQGVPSSSNFPGSQSEATTWTDASGNLWLFGGSQSDSSGIYGTGNDLWRYNPSTSQWTWMGGGTIDVTGVAEGNYGTLGVAAASNLPPGRVGAVGWTDASGNFWLFGGTAYADISSHYETQYYNDLWKYSTASNQWTWMGGSDIPTVSGFDSGVFGTKGTPSTANIPSSRYGSASWTDQSGNLWLMGGSGVDSTGTTAMLNDLWRYSPSSGQWTWMTGNSIVGINNGLSGTTSGVYGSQGVASDGNTPGGHLQGASWIDTSGNLWLFGGWGSDSTGTTGLLNDLWEYSPSANTWTWVSGGTTLPTNTSGLFEAPAGVYGTQGTPSASNVPGGRYIGAAWADASGNFWLFGGVGADSTDTDGLLNDVWVYSSTLNQWTWMGGSTTANAPAVYGTEGAASASNTPGSRAQMLYWMDTTHNLWLFGGGGGSYQDGDPNAFTYYDLWTTGNAGATSPQAATPTFSVAGGNYSSAQSVTISDATSNATIYYTIDGTTPTTGSTVYSGTAIAVSSTETIEAMATASGYTQSATATATYTITAQAKTTPTVTVSPSPASVTTAQALSVTITVSGTPTPTGTVTLSSGTYTSGSVTLTNGAATISIPAGALTTGTDALTATYTPDANSSSTFTSATGTNTVTVTAAVVTAPAASLTPPGPLTFTAVSGSTSAAQTETLSNTGNATLSITSISITGTNASSFAETSTCGATLAAGSDCSIVITFSPSSAGSFTAILSVADNASGSSQTIALNGTGTASTNPTATFILSSLTSTGTVSDTTAATYQLTVTPQNGAFTSLISLSASGVPSGYTASFNPASVTPGSSPATAMLTISKSPTAMLEKTLPFTTPALALIAFFFVPRARRRRLVMLVVFAVGAFAALTFSGCGGGFGLPTTTYNVTIAATGGGVTQSTTVQLTVRQ